MFVEGAGVGSFPCVNICPPANACHLAAAAFAITRGERLDPKANFVKTHHGWSSQTNRPSARK